MCRTPVISSVGCSYLVYLLYHVYFIPSIAKVTKDARKMSRNEISMG